MSETIYQLGNSLYLNITNRCTNRCVFCIRNFTDKVGDKKLVLHKEPSSLEIIESLKKIDLRLYKEVVFCGFGEPLIRVEVVKKISSFIKHSYPSTPIRIDTNGHGNIFNQRNIVPEISPYIDAISISLNAESKEKYNRLSRPIFSDAYEAVIEFIKISKIYIKDVTVSVVNLPIVDIKKCEKIAEDLKVNFKIRDFVRSL